MKLKRKSTITQAQIEEELDARSKRKRELLKACLQGGALLPLGLLAPRLGNQWSHKAPAQFSAAQPHRFLQILLAGGWDSALATDPVRGDKSADGTNYDTAYSSVNQFTVSGKSNLHVGAGLENALPAFAAVPTCFVNGLFVEVTAHELAVNYMLSGRLSLSRSREFPSLLALMGTGAGVFPPHVTLGTAVPLGTTREVNPPLHASDINSFSSMLAGPRSSDSADDPILNNEAVAITDSLINTLNGLKRSAEQVQSATNLRIWSQAESRIQEIYEPRYESQIGLPDNSQIRTDYGLEATGGEGSLEALTAGAFQVLKSGLCPYVTVHAGGFDTHRNHLSQHVPRMASFSTALSRLIVDLQNTPDPAVSSLSLADTTTVVVTSEFVRTPIFNAAAGTDHWQSGSAIIMGKGVRDNTLVGRTNTDARPMGWVSGQPVTFNDSTRITPENLGAGLLRHLGFNNEADSLEATPLLEIFSS